MSVRYIPKHKVQGALLLNVVVAQRATVLELLTSEDQTLLVRRDALLVLDLGLDIVDRVRRLDLKGNRLASQSLDEDLHGRQRRSYDAKGVVAALRLSRPRFAVLPSSRANDGLYTWGHVEKFSKPRRTPQCRATFEPP